MDITFSYNQSENNQLNKVLSHGKTLQGELRASSNVINPVIRFQNDEFMRFNYCYIPSFRRYYFIQSIEAVSNQIFDVTFNVDVLMSFRGDIAQLTAIVDKQAQNENGDEYIDDASLVMDNLMFSRIYNFPDGFNDTPEYILITAG